MAKKALIGVVAVGLVCIAAPARAELCATVWQHRDYGGFMWQIQADAGPVELFDWNDRISSMYVEPGCTFFAFQHPHFGGRQDQFRSAVPYVGDWWNDSISSLICRCPN
ncbi:peptidase inhibitor family I36 protein [Polyangium aurulentum]|uniref:peptidase inhibitor family I36 protein n=1 Tax=Polyangium aurulentum TaxID=2567896 RepID=UPI00146A3661|nr:peptidase inhibitor family I36 protein [Polyangium aurulentum]UQA56096.1 hypothetical protein E8A73_032935 [Polyangium aurulentum]